ncbi:flavoprotein [Micromonospora sp. IBSANI012]|uniref:flavoprotein n=1 Tax=Micromonospora sp. IBSANI012 TaxID=3457761 RepID=UPI004058A73E
MDIEPAMAERANAEGLTLVVGSGSVAAANLGGLAYELGRAQPGPVVVVLTAAARRFVAPTAVRHLGGCPVLGDDSAGGHLEPLHVWLTDVTKRVLVYPASAGFVARMATGMANDLAAVTMLCATGIPTLVVPAMHRRMWTNCQVQRNVRSLRRAGMHVLDCPDGTPPPVTDVVATLIDLPHLGAPRSEYPHSNHLERV